MMKRAQMLPVMLVAALLPPLEGWAQQPPIDFGLIDGTIVFVDEVANARCAAVNTFNADFIVRSCDRRLVLLSGTDRITPYTVDRNYTVTRDNGQPGGILRFASDHDGNRQVFWLSDDSIGEEANLVLEYNPLTDDLEVATISEQDGSVRTLSPLNISQTQCDPFETFDGGTAVLCPRTCGGGAASSLAMVLCLGLCSLRTFRRERGIR